MSKSFIGWDFRINESKKDGTQWRSQELADGIKGLCKNFVFQLEKGELGTNHFQGRFKLFKKTTKNNLLKLLCSNLKCILNDAPQYLEPSVTTQNGGNNCKFDYDCYASKSQTRIGDTITDQTSKNIMKEVYIPKQFRIKIENLYPFQKVMFDDLSFNDRLINHIYTFNGNDGKSTIAHILAILKGGIVVPPVNNAEKMIQSVCDELLGRKIRHTIDIIIDLPRCMNKNKLYEMYSAIEVIKRGCVYDTRHEYRKWYFDCPRIWIFSNSPADTSLLSKDMWNLLTINEKKEFVSANISEHKDMDSDNYIDTKSNNVSNTLSNTVRNNELNNIEIDNLFGDE